MNRQTGALVGIAAVTILVLIFLAWRAGRQTPRPPQAVAMPTRPPATATAAQPSASPTLRPADTRAPSPTAAAPAAAASPSPTATRTPAPTVAPTRTAASSPTPRPTAAPTATPLPAVLTSVGEIADAVDAGRHGVPFSVTFLEQDISDALASYLRDSGDVAFSDVRVVLQPGVAVFSGKAKVAAFNVGFSATTTVIVDNGRPRLKVLRLDMLGGLVPGFIKDRLIQMIEDRANLPLLGDLPVSFDDVTIEPGQVAATGTVI